GRRRRRPRRGRPRRRRRPRRRARRRRPRHARPRRRRPPPRRRRRRRPPPRRPRHARPRRRRPPRRRRAPRADRPAAIARRPARGGRAGTPPGVREEPRPRGYGGHMDLTVVAIPGFFASMAYEARWLKRRAEREGPSPVDYELRDTIASLSMGVGSLIIPPLTAQLFRNFELGRGKWAKPVLGVAGAAALTAVVADAIARAGDQEAGEVPAAPDGPAAADGEALERAGAEGHVDSHEAAAGDPPSRSTTEGVDAERSGAPTASRRVRRWARRVGGSAAVTAIASAGVAAAATWAARTSAQRLFKKRVLPDLGGGPLALAAAVLGWDFIYYWNQRHQHESRNLWAIHVVHHSSQRYNLSTARGQPWAGSLGMFVPYGALALAGIRPNLIETARQINLLYQYWIHTDAIGKLGRWEAVL